MTEFKKKLDSKKIQAKIKKNLGDSISVKDEIALQSLSYYVHMHNQCVENIEANGMTITYFRANGTPAVKENPHVNILLRLSGSISKLTSELGMTPKSRARMSIEEDGEDDSPIASLMDKLKKGTKKPETR